MRLENINDVVERGMKAARDRQWFACAFQLRLAGDLAFGYAVADEFEPQLHSVPLEDVWLTVDDIVGLGRSRRRVLLNISTGKWPSRVSEKRLGNGKPAREVRLSDIPQELQAKWRTERGRGGSQIQV